jgi:hypothetical protein
MLGVGINTKGIKRFYVDKVAKDLPADERTSRWAQFGRSVEAETKTKKNV